MGRSDSFEMVRIRSKWFDFVCSDLFETGEKMLIGHCVDAELLRLHRFCCNSAYDPPVQATDLSQVMGDSASENTLVNYAELGSRKC